MKTGKALTGLYKWSAISFVTFSPLLMPESIMHQISRLLGTVDGNVKGWMFTAVGVTVVGALSRVKSNRKWLNARHFDDDDPTTADPHLYDKGDSRGDVLRAFMPEEKIPDWRSEPFKYLLDNWLRLIAKMDMETGLVTFTFRPVKFLAEDHAGKCTPIPKGYVISGVAGAALINRRDKIDDVIKERSVDDHRFALFFDSLVRAGVKITAVDKGDKTAEQYRNAAKSFNSMGSNIQHLTRAIKDLKLPEPPPQKCGCSVPVGAVKVED